MFLHKEVKLTSVRSFYEVLHHHKMPKHLQYVSETPLEGNAATNHEVITCYTDNCGKCHVFKDTADPLQSVQLGSDLSCHVFPGFVVTVMRPFENH